MRPIFKSKVYSKGDYCPFGRVDGGVKVIYLGLVCRRLIELVVIVVLN